MLILVRVSGDHFWDLIQNPTFEVPKNGGKHTIFASNLWIGGYYNNDLHLAAMTYRQSGSDFWAGPLDTMNGSIYPHVSKQYDKIWKVTKQEIDEFRADNTKMTNNINNWPAHGDTSQTHTRFLAPFVDVDNDGKYDPQNGELS